MADRASPLHPLGLALGAFALIAGCTSVQQITYSDAVNGSEPTQASASTPVGTLAGTSWRLVEIRSTDGTVDRPRDGARYLLSFGTDGTVRVVADCNRGNGTWATEHPSKLRFGAIATTQRMCPQESISDRYLSYFHRIRSYAFSEGRLLLTSGTEGPTLEFAPAAGNAGDG